MKKWLCALILVSACSKDPETENDTQSPSITLNSPANGQVFTSGQSILISGTITDNNYIAEVHIHVSNTITGSQLMDVHLYPAGSTMNFNQSISATTGSNYRIQVIAKDKAVNESRQTADVSCN